MWIRLRALTHMCTQRNAVGLRAVDRAAEGRAPGIQSRSPMETTGRRAEAIRCALTRAGAEDVQKAPHSRRSSQVHHPEDPSTYHTSTHTHTHTRERV